MDILLADSETLVRDSIRMLLETEGNTVVAEASNGREAVRLACEIRPDIAILDVVLPMLNGLDAACEIARVCPRTKTILLTAHPEPYPVLKAIQLGVRGYLLKSQSANDLLRAIREVHGGGVALAPQVSATVVEAQRKQGGTSQEPLTPRLRQVLQLVAEGKSTKEIAVALGLSVRTAESHRHRLMRNLHLHGTAQLVRYAIRRGLIEP